MEYDSSFLIHYGVPGMKWGVRRFQQPNGGLTSLGRQRSIEYYRLNERPSMSQIRSSNNKTQAFTRNRSAKKMTKQQKERAKKMIIAAGAITLAAATAYGIHRYNNTTKTLSQLAKKKIEDDFDYRTQGLTDGKLAKEMSNKTKRMLNVDTRSGARKELGLKNRKAYKAYMHNNGIKKLKAIDIAAQRSSSKEALNMIKGQKRSMITKKLRPYTERELERARKNYLKRVVDTRGA